MRTRIYSLKTQNGVAILDMALGLLVASETNSQITINLPSGQVTLNKFDYLNEKVVYDDGRCFFILCTKSVDMDYAFKVLMEYAINKIDKRIDYLTGLKKEYQKELTAA